MNKKRGPDELDNLLERTATNARHEERTSTHSGQKRHRKNKSSISVLRNEGEDEDCTLVEFATLVLPSDAEDVGIQSGDGTQIHLEGSALAGANIDTTPTAAHIEGVVDLDDLSMLIPGVTGKELVGLLNQEVQDTDTATTAEEDIREETADEEMPLVSRPRGESIALSADPFVETLAQTMIPSSPDSQGHPVTKLETTNHEAHEAFLLSIPATQQSSTITSPEDHDRMILALPEIETNKDEVEEEEDFPALVKRYSTLPTDIQHVELHATSAMPTVDEASKKKPCEEEIHLDLVIERKVPLIGYVILITGLFALASVGAALDLQQGGVSPNMKCLWRLSATTLALFPLAAKSIRKEEFAKLSRQEICFLFPICAFCYCFMTTAFVVALEMTSLANAFILSNLTSLVIIFSKLALGLPVLFLEGLGATIGLAGALVCAGAPPDVATIYDDMEPTRRLGFSLFGGDSGGFELSRESWGNLIAFLASVGTAMYLVIAKNLRTKIDLFVFMFFLFLFGSVYLLIYMWVMGEHFTFNLHPVYGIFGWMNPVPDRLPLELYMAFVCNLIGTTGYVAVMKYFDPVVVSMVMLTEPVIAALLSVVAGVDRLPGMQVWIGDIIVTIGSSMVIYSGSQKVESIDATKAFITPKMERPAVVRSPFISKGGRPPKRHNLEDEDNDPANKPIVIWERGSNECHF